MTNAWCNRISSPGCKFDFEWLVDFLENLEENSSSGEDDSDSSSNSAKKRFNQFHELALRIAKSKIVPVELIVRYIPRYIPAVKNLQLTVDVLQGSVEGNDSQLGENELEYQVCGIWLWGGPGTGKSTLVRDIGNSVQSILGDKSVDIMTAGKTGGFFQGLASAAKMFVLDEYSPDKLPFGDVLTLISTGSLRLNQKGGHVTLNDLRLVIIISNFPISYFVKLKSFKKQWLTVNQAAFRRRFTEIAIGDPTMKLCKSLGLSDKRAYAAEVVGTYTLNVITDVLRGETKAQRESVRDHRRTVIKNLVKMRLSDCPETEHIGEEVTMQCTPVPHSSPTRKTQSATKSLMSQTTPYRKALSREKAERSLPSGSKRHAHNDRGSPICKISYRNVGNRRVY